MSNKQYSSAPEMFIDRSAIYQAIIEMESGEEVLIELLTKEVPVTVNNFIFLAQEGYYDGVTFHRVIPGFMAQTGDPTGTGSGGPGYSFDNEFHPDARHDKPGVVSMANSGVVNGLGTNGSQFFITYTETSYLDGLNPDDSSKPCGMPGTSCHSMFGRVLSGMDVVISISERDPSTSTSKGDMIKTIRIERTNAGS